MFLRPESIKTSEKMSNLKILLLFVSSSLAAEYTYDAHIKLEVLSTDWKNKYAVIGDEKTIRCDKGPCNIEWLRDIDEDTSVGLQFFTDYRNKTTMDYCEAATQPPESLINNVWRLSTQLFFGGATECPIAKAKFQVPGELDFTFEVDEKIKCGPADLTISVILTNPEEEGIKKPATRDVQALSIWTSYTLADGVECNEK